MTQEDIDDINMMLEEASRELYDERIEQQYQDFLEELYYYWECEQWDKELELYYALD